MSNKGRTTPRVVCCAIPVARAANKVLVITSRKRQQNWVVPKGGWEPKDVELAQAALREAWEEAGVRGTVSRFVTTVQSPATTYHFFELEVLSLDADWPEAKERAREWVDFPEALRRMAWKQELAQGLALCSLNTQLPRR